MITFITLNTAEPSWLDHTDVGTEGTWKLFSTGRSPTFTNWSKGQPDNYKGNQDCAYSYFNRKTGAWDDGNCGHKIGLICEISGRLIILSQNYILLYTTPNITLGFFVFFIDT